MRKGVAMVKYGKTGKLGESQSMEKENIEGGLGTRSKKKKIVLLVQSGRWG
jgi:hypothetical protein